MADDDAYQRVVGGKLKLKRSSKRTDSSTKKRKKGGKRESEKQVDEKVQLEVLDDTQGTAPLTESERKFLEIQEKRELQLIESKAKSSHRERIQEFNAKLSRLSEHYDIPKVGPG